MSLEIGKTAKSWRWRAPSATPILRSRSCAPPSGTMQIRYLDGARLRRSLMAACAHARGARQELNRINVFPVPDGDTGTNLALTVKAIEDRIRPIRERAADAVARTAAQAAVLGARGNCGMMLSHFLLGFAEHTGGRERLAPDDLARALQGGAGALRDALERPVEGTILTVIRETAEAAASKAFDDFVPMVRHLVREARASLARTPDLLPVLKQSGVVDAGAKGFVTLLEGVQLYIEGRRALVEISEEDDIDAAPAAARVAFPGDSEPYRYCTEGLVRGEALPSQVQAREALRGRGDSLIVVRSGDVLKVHIHTDEPESVFAYLRSVGTLVTHKAEDMRAQHEAVERAAGRHVGLARRPVAVLADSAADLPEEVVRAHGITVVPMLLISGGEAYRDGVDITAEEFHRRMAEDEEIPTTSQPAPADFLEGMSRAAEEGEAVVGVVVSSALSGTFASAEAAAWRFDEAPVHLADSLGASLLQGLLVLKACELAELATPPERIVAELARIRRRSGILFTVDRFDRLRASGRVGFGSALLAGLLRIKPILELDTQGKVARAAQAIGREGARASLLQALAERVGPDARTVRFGIIHVGYPEIVDVVAGELRRRYGADVEILSAPATPVIATHIGIGAWGVAYMVEDAGSSPSQGSHGTSVE